MDKETNRSRGYGFVEMPDNASAKKAIQEPNGITIDGRPITVTEAQPDGGKRTFNNDRQKW